MNIRHDVRVDVHVVLSKRNLDTLLAMLDHPEVTGTTLYRQTPNGYLAVTVESDADHYDSPERGVMQGKMGIGPEDVVPHAQ